MNTKAERLKSLDTQKLIDVVKNYRQYEYDVGLRDKAIEILKERGVDNDFLSLTGNLENKNYTYAEDLYQSFLHNSKTAFILYWVFILSMVLGTVLQGVLLEVAGILGLLSLGAFVIYLVHLFRAMLNQINFDKLVDRHASSEWALLYIAVGMPLYMFSYFYFKNQMKEQMRMIK